MERKHRKKSLLFFAFAWTSLVSQHLWQLCAAFLIQLMPNVQNVIAYDLIWLDLNGREKKNYLIKSC
jgi:hypothetical protein